MAFIREMTVDGDDGRPARILRIRERQPRRVLACLSLAALSAYLAYLFDGTVFGLETDGILFAAAAGECIAMLALASIVRIVDVFEDGSAVVRSGFVVPMWRRRHPMRDGGRLSLVSSRRLVESEADPAIDNDCFIASVDANGWPHRLLAPSAESDLAAIREAIERHTRKPLMFHRWNEMPAVRRR